jgi:small subunit ribosomal protein S15
MENCDQKEQYKKHKENIMSVTKTKKSELIQAYKVSENDNGGSVESQVAVLTERIRNLTEHMKANHKDNHSKRGLLLMVNRRKKLLAYIKKRNPEDYENLIKKLGLRK